MSLGHCLPLTRLFLRGVLTFWLKLLFPGSSVTNLGLGLLFSCFRMEHAMDVSMAAKHDARREAARESDPVAPQHPWALIRKSRYWANSGTGRLPLALIPLAYRRSYMAASQKAGIVRIARNTITCTIIVTMKAPP